MAHLLIVIGWGAVAASISAPQILAMPRPTNQDPSCLTMPDEQQGDQYEPTNEQVEFHELARPIEFEGNSGPDISGYLKVADRSGPLRGQVQLPTEAMDPVSLLAFKGKEWTYKGPLYLRDGSVVSDYETVVEISQYGFSDRVWATIFARHSTHP